jgi:hypothetical protein
MTEVLVVVFGLGAVVAVWLIVRLRHARENLDVRKRAAGLGSSRLGRRLFVGRSDSVK